MEDDLFISVNSSCKEVAEAFSKKFQLKDNEKQKLINEGISGDVLSEFLKYKRDLKFTAKSSFKIEEYLKQNGEKFKPKEIDKNISIENEKDIKNFFAKYIEFDGSVEDIKEINDLKQLKEEDMKKMGLNIGQRIRLSRYVHYFNSLGEKKRL